MKIKPGPRDRDCRPLTLLGYLREHAILDRWAASRASTLCRTRPSERAAARLQPVATLDGEEPRSEATVPVIVRLKKARYP